MNKFFLALFLSTLIIISNKEFKYFRCAADKLDITPLNFNFSEKEEKRRLAVDYSAIRIGVDYASFSKPNSMSNDTYNKIKSLIEETITEFQKFLKVQHTEIDLSGQDESIKKTCQINAVDGYYVDNFKNNDVVIFPTFNSELEEDELSSAKLCLTNGNRPRPIAGVIQLNPNINMNLNNADAFMKKILFHEITHILVFDKNLLRQLGLLTTKNSKLYVTSTKALSKIKRHFKCSALSGLPFEDQDFKGNTPGSHWDARYMLGDYMIPLFYSDMVLSDITLALFEDTKFYEVDYYSGGLFKFGKNKGCDFINKNCIINKQSAYDEFCTSFETPLCTNSRITKSNCIINDYIKYNITIPNKYRYFDNPNQGGYFYADFCPVPEAPNSNTDYLQYNCRFGSSSLPSEYGEEISDTSFCFVSSLTPSSYDNNVTFRSMCYKTECHKDTLQIIVYVGDSTFICPTNGGIISGTGFKGVLTCPKYYEICDTESNQLCNDMFDCLSKKIEVSDDSFTMSANTTFDRYIPTVSAEKIKNNFYSFVILIIIIFLN